MKLRILIWGTFAFLILAAGFGYYSVFMSPLAANWVLEKSLRDSGMTFEPAVGDLATGLMIPTIRKKSEEYDISIDNVKFQYSAIMDLLMEKKFKVDSYSIERIELDIKKAELASVFTGTESSENAHSPKTIPGQKIFSDFTFLSKIEVTTFQINNFQIRYPVPGMAEKKNLKVKKMEISGFELSAERLFFSNAEFKSDDTDVMIAGLEMRDGEIKKIGNMIGTLRVSYAPHKMKKDVDYVIKYIAGAKGFGIHFRGFNGKMNAVLNAKDPVQLSLINFNYSEYFKESFPISSLNVQLKAANILFFMTGVIEAKGAFMIGDIPFKVVEKDPNQITNPEQIAGSSHRGVVAMGEKGNQKFTVTFLVDRFMSEAQKVVLMSVPQDRKPAALGLPENGVGLLADFPVLAFESNLTRSAQDNFAFLYYGLPYAEIDEIQKTRVNEETWIFDKSFPPAPKVVRKIEKPAQPLRKPASKTLQPAPKKSSTPPSRRR